VVGAGPAAVSMHLPALAALRDRGKMVLALICDLDHARAADAQARFGFLEKTGEAVAALERQDIDAVYIFGSAQLHYSLGLAALERGKHLFVEKPIAPSFTQACEMADAARNHGRIAVGGHNRRFYRAFELLRERSGALGWRYAEAVFHKPESSVPAPFGARTWLGANGIHALDALVFMMGGLPEQLYAVAGEPGGIRPSCFSAIMRWSDGSQGVFLCNNNAGARREEYVFHRIGETYRITDTGVLAEKNGNAELHALSSLGDGIAAEHDAFLDAVLVKSLPPHSIAAIAPSLFLAELIESGFNGSVSLAPAVIPAIRANPHGDANPHGEQSILISKAAPLLPSIARMLPHHRLAAIEDVVDSSRERPDIVAAILGAGSIPMTAPTLAKLPRLSVVGVMGLSLARHSPATLLARGVTVVNASSAYASSAAEFTLALAVLARRRAFTSHELMRAGGWGTAARAEGLKALVLRVAHRLRPAAEAAGLEKFLLRWWRTARAGRSPSARRRAAPGDLCAASVALIGWGAISQQLAHRLTGMKVRVLVYSEHGSAGEIRAAGAIPVSLNEALACDIVSLHRGLTPRTRHFLGAPELSQLRPGAILINVARGALVDPAALLARLQQGDIFACLDTYEDEPLSPADPLRRLRNVFLTSHIAGGSQDMHAAAAEEVVRKVALHLKGGGAEGISLARLSTMT
jgi:phosphoglycerate dehydrogenase-like enzyme/predicted dehydrogenase